MTVIEIFQRDNFSAGDVYKTFAYVFLYAVVQGVDIRDCTPTLVSAKKPTVLTDCLKTAFGCRVEKTAAGMYCVHGAAFPIRIIETMRLSERENLWLNKSMGASWFVSYSYYSLRDKNHRNWEKVSMRDLRISVSKRTQNLHQFWLRQVLDMDDDNLEKNEIELTRPQIKRMASALLLNW